VLIAELRVAAGVCLFAASAAAAAFPPPEKVALTNARIIPVVGDVIEKGTILIERGKIAAIGAKVEVPYDARVFDLTGKTVFPGMIIAHTWYGLDEPNESRPIVAHLDVQDAIDPSQNFFEDCLRYGVTAVHVSQAHDTVIGAVTRRPDRGRDDHRRGRVSEAGRRAQAVLVGRAN
jgi:imidazolonepropionase-like amidohydrolase